VQCPHGVPTLMFEQPGTGGALPLFGRPRSSSPSATSQQVWQGLSARPPEPRSSGRSCAIPFGREAIAHDHDREHLPEHQLDGDGSAGLDELGQEAEDPHARPARQ
jgi:hypothetical protein